MSLASTPVSQATLRSATWSLQLNAHVWLLTELHRAHEANPSPKTVILFILVILDLVWRWDQEVTESAVSLGDEPTRAPTIT